ncbi:MAG: HAMP domain-containing sensor histidine kinase [Psychrobacter sp.]|nr:HAMP domain-containing sensor histidine kinase [Psychrobacter sp.]
MPSSPIKLTLFWRLFLSLLGIVLLTSVLSILVERYLMTQAIDERMRNQVAFLTDLQSELAVYLESGDMSAAEALYRKHRGLGHQIIVTDNSGAILLPKRRQKPPLSPNPRTSDAKPVASKANLGHEATLNATLDSSVQGNVLTQLPTTEFLLSKPAEAALKAWRAGSDLPEMSVTLQDGSVAYIRLNPRLPFRDIMAMQQGSLGVRLGLLILFSILVCYALSRSLTNRIHEVQRRVHQLTQGDYTGVDNEAGSAMRSLGSDELGALAQDIALLSQRLTQSEQARQQMLSDISHELRSPLSRLDVATELARDISIDQVPKALPYLDRIQKESARLNTLIGQIIHIQSLQMGIGTGAPDKQHFDLIALIKTIGTDVCFEFQHKQIDWQLLAPHKLMIYADEEQIHSALENIIRNAFIHTPEAHRVTVIAQTLSGAIHGFDVQDNQTPHSSKVMRESNANNVNYSSTMIEANANPALSHNLSNKEPSISNQLQIVIEDEGGGIAEAELEHIFEPFVRLDSARQRQTGGYGLGLAIARGVINAHGGQLRAANSLGQDSGNKGLIIKIVLPLK